MGAAFGLLGGVLNLIGAAQQAKGEKIQAQAAATSYMFQAMVARNNERVAQMNQAWTAEQGDTEAATEGMKTEAGIAGMKAGEAAHGIDVGSGSATTARAAADRIGMVNAMTIRSNAAREAWGYGVQKTSEEAQAQADARSAEYSIKAGKVAAAGTMLSGFGSLVSSLGSFSSAGGFGGGTSPSSAGFPSMGGPAGGGGSLAPGNDQYVPQVSSFGGSPNNYYMPGL